MNKLVEALLRIRDLAKPVDTSYNTYYHDGWVRDHVKKFVCGACGRGLRPILDGGHEPCTNEQCASNIAAITLASPRKEHEKVFCGGCGKQIMSERNSAIDEAERVARSYTDGIASQVAIQVAHGIGDRIAALKKGSVATGYSKTHLQKALTWIENNISGGVSMVARALSETGPAPVLEPAFAISVPEDEDDLE